MKVSELERERLDYWVARSMGYNAHFEFGEVVAVENGRLIHSRFKPSTDWAQGGPLIEKYFITPYLNSMRRWDGYHPEALKMHQSNSKTPLEAVCRALVCIVFGDEVEDV